MLPRVVAANSRRSSGGGCREHELRMLLAVKNNILVSAHLVLAAVPVAAGHWGVEAQRDKIQSEEADVGAQLGQPVLTRRGCCGGGRVPGVHHVAGVEADLEVTSGGAEDAASPEAGGTGTISQGPGPPLTLGGGDTCSR